MNMKLLLVSCLLISSQAFAQSIFRQTNAAPVEDRVIKKVELIEDEKSIGNCIGSIEARCTIINVETSAVSPQSSIEPISLEPMSPAEEKRDNFPVKNQIVDISKESGSEPIALAAYPKLPTSSVVVKDSKNQKIKPISDSVNSVKKTDKNIIKTEKKIIKKIESSTPTKKVNKKTNNTKEAKK